ncbi:hypothetical protein [Nocardioides sp. InS609-2]|uniref:hypothetical protein n=1 Tax=Nocardioides sp. InS609-2 TaxID=2760705 RepID=UPI0020C15FD9|nr:hypothetical protein [Nocardioides sp. InS609-2]
MLTDPRHRPGDRRSTSLWDEIDAASRRSAPASSRMVARAVRTHLVAHESSLLSIFTGIELLPTTPDPSEPTPA